MDDSPVYGVLEITRAVKEVVRENFQKVAVEGEIADFTHYRSSGHMYFSLSEEGARLQGVMFRRANESLDFQPEEGMTVIAHGHLDVYEQRGEYQLIAEEMEESGLGELEREFQELKETLEEEGALDSTRKRALPYLPRTIGVVTSGDGAAFWDIVRTLRRRCPVLRVVLYPCRVNSRESGEEIASAIRRIPELDELDVLIVGRGGGSPEDLWGFNTEPVARAILDCPVPVVSAVGHEVDVTISDLVADHRSATPSAAGEEVAPSLEEIRERLRERIRRIRSSFRDDLDRRRDKLRFLSEKRVFADPSGWIRPFQDRYQRFKQRLHAGYEKTLSEQKNRFLRLREQMNALGPESVLERGYTLASRDGELVTSVDAISPGDSLSIQWHDGKADVEVDSVGN